MPAAQLSSATSLFLAVFAVVTLYLAVASLRTDLALTVIIWLIFVGLVLLSIGAGTSSSGLTKAGGWVVLLSAGRSDILSLRDEARVIPVSRADGLYRPAS